MSDTDQATVTVGSYRIEPLKAHNWMPWKRQMLAVLRDQGLDKYLEDDAPIVSDSTKADEVKALQKWKEGDRKTQARIELAISDSEMVHVMGAKTAKEMWKQLSTVKESRGQMGMLAARRRLMRTTAEEGFNMADHIATLRQIQEELHVMGNVVTDEDFAMILVTSLPESWDTFTTTFFRSRSNQTSKIQSQELVGILIDEFRRRMEREGNSGGVALQAKEKGYGNGGASDVECFNCRKKGHLKKDCWSKGGGQEGKGPGKGRRRRDRANQATDQSTSTDLNNLTFFASVALSVGSDHTISKSDWILDSGTTSHICPTREAFSDYTPLKGCSVEGVRGKLVTVEGRGTVTVIFDVNGKTLLHHLKETLHVPGAPNNLYSVSRLDEGGGGTMFKGGECFLKEKGGSVVGLGTKRNRLYVLKAQTKTLTKQSALLSSPAKLTWNQLHLRFGHVSISTLQQLIRNNLVTGINVDTMSIPSNSCEACIQGKMTHRSFPKQSQNRSKTPGERQLSDVCGPIPIKSIGGYKYFISFTDDASRYSQVLFLKDKGEAHQRIADYCAKVERQFGRYPRWLRFDNGKEYVNEKVRTWADSRGITLEMTAPYSSAQNGVAERFNRTYMELARSMIVAKGLPTFLWDEAVAHANYIRNRVGTKALEGRTPYEAWFGRKPDVSHFREFGCDVWVLDETQNLSKLLPKAQKMVFTGFIDGSKSIRFYDPKTRKIKVSCNVSFHENKAPSIVEFIEHQPRLSSEGEREIDPADETNPKSPEAERSTVPSSLPEDPAPKTTGKRSSPRNQPPVDYKLAANPQARKPAERFTETMQTDATPIQLPYGDLRYTPDPPDPSTASLAFEKAFLASADHQTLDTPIPRSVEDALKGNEAEEWLKAIMKELETLEKMKTWELVSLPPGRTAIGSRIILNKKRDAQRRVTQFKARLVAQGFSQKPGTDFNQDATFAPVMRFETLRTCLALSAVNGWSLRQLDVKGAYLNGYLDEEIYMRQPPGFEDGTARVCRLKRSLYGLKQAGNVWNRDLDKSLLDLNFRRLRSDNCCYIREIGNEFDILLIWVDDFLSIASSDSRSDIIERDLRSKYEIKSLGAPSMLLGLHLCQDRKNHSISLSQTAYIDTLLERFCLADVNPVSTPLDPNVNLDIKDNDTNTPADENEGKGRITEGYSALIGSLMYLAISTRPDIAFAVNKLAQFTSDPKTKHWTAVKRIFRYLKGTRSFALAYGGTDPDILTEDLNIYCDADWASSQDRKSTSGYVITIAGGAVAWSSKKQTLSHYRPPKPNTLLQLTSANKRSGIAPF